MISYKFVHFLSHVLLCLLYLQSIDGLSGAGCLVFPSAAFLIQGGLFGRLKEPIGLEGSHQTSPHIVRTIALPVGPSEGFVDRFQVPRDLIESQTSVLLLLSKNLD